MAENRERETVYAIPEFWVKVYKHNLTDMWCLDTIRYTPDEAAAMLAREAERGNIALDIPSYVTVARATWQIRDTLDGPKTPTLVWSNAPWWDDNRHIWQDHGLRPSTTHPGLLSYYQTAEKACRGIRTPIKAGRYLGKFFANVLVEKERARMARWFETGSLECEYDNEQRYPLEFAKTRKEIRSVYVNGPASCMAGDDWDECGGRHPCEAYAAGDLAIAYLSDCSNGTADDAKIKARALVWPDRKVFGRVYPTAPRFSEDGFLSQDDSQSMQDALRNRLLALGYNTGSFDGAKLRRIELDGGTYLMPYLDGKYAVNDDGDNFIMSRNGAYQSDNTDGTIEIEDNRTTCDRCDDRVDEDDTHSVYTRAGTYGGRGEETWCSCCYENNTFTCEGFNDTFSDDVNQVEVGGSTYTLAYARENFTRSDFSDEYFDGESIEVDGETWSQDEFEEHGFTCAIDGDNYHEKHRHPDYPEIHCDADPDDIAEWLKTLETSAINDTRQLEIAT